MLAGQPGRKCKAGKQLRRVSTTDVKECQQIIVDKILRYYPEPYVKAAAAVWKRVHGPKRLLGLENKLNKNKAVAKRASFPTLIFRIAKCHRYDSEYEKIFAEN